MLNWIPDYDGWILVTGMLCAVAASIPGNFLVLRRMSMLGDSISHAVLPGLAVAFLVSGSRSGFPMFLGALAVGILTAVLTEWIRRFGEVDEGASMGVVFTTFFALGLVMIVQAADHVDLDPGCVLYGSIEQTPYRSSTWTLPGDTLPIPLVVLTLAPVLLINMVIVGVFYKELKITAFDPALAQSMGISRRKMHYLLMVIVAITAVASFESVGNILVVAMFVVPPATARLLTERLGRMILLSAVIAAASAVFGHLGATTAATAAGLGSLNISGMMAVAAGLLFCGAALFSPSHGVVVTGLRRSLLAIRILSEDVVALLYRMEERQPGTTPAIGDLCDILLARPLAVRAALWWQKWAGRVEQHGVGWKLTVGGRTSGLQLVRSHRLWEQYLIDQAGVSMDRIHDQAERLEHYTGRDLRTRLDEQMSTPQTDPHGSPIPEE
ncbi:MAG: metal ABC transporter permease [Planctomycetaceae bacterium]|nr:metal ABC transporter permease [Planctomycetaceae bacterium]